MRSILLVLMTYAATAAVMLECLYYSTAQPLKQRADCYVVGRNKSKLFIGSKFCYSLFPVQNFAGTWVVGPEESSFYYDDIKHQKDDTWLEIEHSLGIAGKQIVYDGKHHKFRIKFLGRRPDKDGLYGHGGVSNRGILVEKIISLKEL